MRNFAATGLLISSFAWHGSFNLQLSGCFTQPAKTSHSSRKLITDAAGQPHFTRHLLKVSRRSLDASWSQSWSGLTPQGPYFRESGARKTILRNLVPGQVWSLEQVQGVIYVHVPVRMTIVKTSEGLLGYSAVAPTEEMLGLLRSLEDQEGSRLVHLVLPTTAAEHKLFAVALAQVRSDLHFWIVPDQFAFPINLPNELLGFPVGRTTLIPLPYSTNATPWSAEVPYRMLGPLPSKDGISIFEELCAYHSASETLLCCDLLVSVPQDPPDIVLRNDARALWWHGRDKATDDVVNAEAVAPFRLEKEREGWQKIALFSLYFQSEALGVANEPDGSISGALKFFQTAFPEDVSENARQLGWGAFYPFTWKPEWRSSFEYLSCAGALLVPPILAVLILNRRPRQVLEFVDEICTHFQFKRVVSCHFDAPAPAEADDVRDAFSFLEEGVRPVGELNVWEKMPWQARRRGEQPTGDLAFLVDFEKQLTDLGSIFPREPKVRRSFLGALEGSAAESQDG